jgi:MraZ protein
MEARTGGIYPSTLDEKGRLSIPIKLRDKYTGDLMIVQALGAPCVWIMKPGVYDHMCGRLFGFKEITEFDRLSLERQLVAMDLDVDRTGRIAVPSAMRRYGKLTKDCLVLNLENRLELWDEETYFVHKSNDQSETVEAIKKMGSLGLFSLS